MSLYIWLQIANKARKQGDDQLANMVMEYLYKKGK